MDNASTPSLSVVIVILDGRVNLTRILQALRSRKGVPDLEIIVPHQDSFAEVAAGLASQFPEVKFLHLVGTYRYAELRAAGVRATRGRIIAITEDQCIPPPRWCANIVAAHAAPHAAIGGPVDKFTPDKLINWAIYLREFGMYMPPAAEGPLNALTDCNVTYKREALEAISGVWREAFHELIVHAAIQKTAGTLWLSPALLTMQQRDIDFGPALRERYAFGRLYGILRAKMIPRSERIYLTIASPILPPLLTARVYAQVFTKKRFIGPALAALPYVFLFACVWMLGEFTGYLTKKPE